MPPTQRKIPVEGWLLLLFAACMARGCGGEIVQALPTDAGASSAESPDAAGEAGPPLDAGPGMDGAAASDLQVVFRPEDGTFDVSRAGDMVFRRATADALVDGDPSPRTLSLAGPCKARRQDPGAFVCEAGDLTLRLRIEIRPGARYLTAQLEVENTSAGPLTLRRLAPLVIGPEQGGALLLGKTPAHHRILENGRFIAFDQTVQLEAGDVKPFPLGAALGIPLRGNSVANWNHIVADLDDPSRSLVAGYLSFDRAVPTLGIAAGQGSPEADGRTPFLTYAAESSLVFHGKTIAPGERLRSELLYLDPLPPDPLEALERYASELAARRGITAWTKRGSGRAVPTGWNSWTGGSSTGGYGQSMNEAIFFSNMDVMKMRLLPFGDAYFQLDDGWQQATGDWRFRPDAFPSGSAAVAGRIKAAGLAPGLWLAPFLAGPGTAVAAQHPDWLTPREDGIIGTFGKDHQSLDTSNPAVLAYLGDLFGQLRADGWAWIKGDFTYLALLGKPQSDPSLTNVEAWRAGWKAIRDALGPDIFLLGIGLMGPNIGVLDGMRLTLDNGPQWEEQNLHDIAGSGRSLKATVRNGSRRWFYQNRVWENHDDLIFFRAWPDDPSIPPLRLDESRSFATWVGLGGGTVELGDKLVDLGPEAIDIVRRLLPVYPEGARPLDVLVRDYPEQFRQRVSAPAGEWDNIGLFHWGKNRDWSVSPPAPLDDQTPRSFTVGCPRGCLAYEFWSQTYLGDMPGDFQVSVDPHKAKVIALRKPLSYPQLLGSNRHVTQGANDMGPLLWDAAARRLSGTLAGAVGTPEVPFSYELAFHAPSGFTASGASVDGVDSPMLMQDGELVRLGFALPPTSQGQSVAFQILFQ